MLRKETHRLKIGLLSYNKRMHLIAHRTINIQVSNISTNKIIMIKELGNNLKFNKINK